MPPLTTDQLEAIQRLLAEPLRQAVRAEMQAGHERLAGAIEKVAEHLAAHVADTAARDRARGARLDAIDRRVATLEAFRGKVLLVYGAGAFALSFAWSLTRDWVVGVIRRK
jgi:hypothetical protein